MHISAMIGRYVTRASAIKQAVIKTKGVCTMSNDKNDNQRTLSDALLFASLASARSTVIKSREAEARQERIDATPIAPHLAALRP